MHNLNVDIFYFINSFAGNSIFLDSFMVFITKYLAWFVSILIVAHVVLWHPFKTPLGLRKIKSLALSFEIALSVAMTWFVIKAIKLLVAHPRPFESLANVNTLISIPGGDSFPSNHAALSFAVATVLYFHHKRAGKVLFIFAVIVSISRLYVGVHYPLDILAGAAFGYAIPTLIHKAFSQNVKKGL